MSIEELYNHVRNEFPELIENTDNDYRYRWGNHFSAYMWFESLANTVNSHMSTGQYVDQIQALFDFLSQQFDCSSDSVKDCIDTSFVENLFWHVDSKASAKFWNRLPNNFKTLYLNFHQKKPY